MCYVVGMHDVLCGGYARCVMWWVCTMCYVVGMHDVLCGGYARCVMVVGYLCVVCGYIFSTYMARVL